MVIEMVLKMVLKTVFLHLEAGGKAVTMMNEQDAESARSSEPGKRPVI
jgi:hypothetical protein